MGRKIINKSPETEPAPLTTELSVEELNKKAATGGQGVGLPISPTPSPIVIKGNDHIQYLKELKNRIFLYTGKSGMNPFLWWARSGAADLERRVQTGDNSQELIDKVLALQFSEPKVDFTRQIPEREKEE